MTSSSNKKINILELIMGVGTITTLLLAGKYKIIGFVGLGFIFFSLILNLRYRKIKLDSKLQKVIIINIIYLTVHFTVFCLMGKIYKNSVYNYLQQICIYLYVFLIVGSKINCEGTKKISKIFSILFIIITFFICSQGLKTLKYSEMFNTQFGMCMLPAIGYMLLNVKRKKMKFILFVLTGIGIYLADARAAIGALLILGITYFIWTTLKKHKKIGYAYFIGAIIICILIPIVYVNIANGNGIISSKINEITIKLTGSRFNSGRDVFWPYIINKIKSAPIFGSGIGITVSEIYDTTFSTHNLFFFILMQTGSVGLILFVYMLYCMWEEYLKSEQENVKIFAAFMLAILIQQTFSLGLLTGKMALAIPSWTLMSLGVTFNNKNKEGE